MRRTLVGEKATAGLRSPSGRWSEDLQAPLAVKPAEQQSLRGLEGWSVGLANLADVDSSGDLG